MQEYSAEFRFSSLQKAINDMSREQNFFIAGAGDLALDAWGAQKVVHPHSLFHSTFTFDVPVKKWNSIINGTEQSLIGSTLVTSVDGKLSVKTAATNGNVTYLHSRRHPRYQPNRGHLYSTSMFIPNPTDNAVEDFGLFTDIDGVFFRVDVNGVLYACLQSDGAVVYQERIHIPFDLDLTKGNIYDIQYKWRGAGGFKWFIGRPDDEVLTLVHYKKFLNTQTVLTVQNPSLPAAFRVTSLGDAGELQCGCIDITSEGGDDRHETYESAKSLEKAVNAPNTPVLIIHSPNQINGKMNTIDGRLARLSGASDKRSIFQVWATRDATAFTGAVFNRAGTSTYVEFDIAATSVDTAKLEFVNAFRVDANSYVPLENPAKNEIDFFFIHGDYLVITATAAAGTCDATFEWGEER